MTIIQRLTAWIATASSWFSINDTRNMNILMPRKGVSYSGDVEEPKEPCVKDGPTDIVNTDLAWRDLALQFDEHRMMALGHLKTLLNDPVGHQGRVKEFLTQRPLSGEKVLENRLKAIVASKVQDNTVKLLDMQ